MKIAIILMSIMLAAPTFASDSNKATRKVASSSASCVKPGTGSIECHPPYAERTNAKGCEVCVSETDEIEPDCAKKATVTCDFNAGYRNAEDSNGCIRCVKDVAK